MITRSKIAKALCDLVYSGPGFSILKGWAPDPSHVVDTYRRISVEPIFNSSTNDNKRKQATLVYKSNNIKAGPYVPTPPRTDWLNAVLTKIGKESQRMIGGVVLLRSEPCCQAQMAHCDYIPKPDMLESTDSTVPQLLLVALEDETTMDVWPGSHRLVRGSTDIQDPVSVVHVSLNKGDALLFRGDLVHAGSAYTQSNVRVHFYLDSPLVKRVANRTWIISKHAGPGVADMIKEEP